MTGSISDRQIEALGAIAEAGHDIAAALRETPQPEEAQIAAPVPAEQPDSGSGDSRTGESVDGAPAGWQPVEGAPWMEWRRQGRTVRFRKAADETLGGRLRALIPETYTDDGYFGVTALEIREFAEEADRLEGKRARQAQSISDLQDVRERLTDQVERVRALLGDLAANYQTRADSSPTPLAQWRDVAADVRRVLATVAPTDTEGA